MKIKFVCTVLSALFAYCAHAQNPISLDIKLNYGFAYRNAHWSRVEVTVSNRLKDVEGVVEVRFLDNVENVLSPLYRAELDSPLNSTKIYSFDCYIQNASRVEARIFDGGSLVRESSTFINIVPIRTQDKMCLVLDNKPDYYGFISTAAYGEQEDVRVHREALATDQLFRLADHSSLYDAFDLVVLGEINPQDIPEERRGILLDYVRSGGTLAVMLGENAAAYENSWILPHLGATISGRKVDAEPALARSFFGADSAVARPQMQGAATLLQPAEGSRRSGAEHPVAVLRPLGTGSIVTFAVDAESGLLQHEPQFGHIWRNLLDRRIALPELSWTSLADNIQMWLPTLAGVTITSFSSVAWYLGLYFFVGIVGNWLFWNFLKRREYSWLTLALFSIGFTVYAVFYGTQGRVRRTEIETVSILRLPEGSTMARERVYTGLLAEGTNRYDGTITSSNAVVSDPMGWMTERFDPYGNPDRRSAGNRYPYYVWSDDPPRFSNLRIGASEMRTLLIEQDIPLEGGVESTLVYKGGVLAGSITNKSGLVIKNAAVACYSKMFPLCPDGENVWRVCKEADQKNPLIPSDDVYYSIYHTYPGSPDAENHFLTSIVFSSLGIENRFGNNNSETFSATSALFVAHVAEPAPVVQMANEATPNLRYRMLFIALPEPSRDAQNSDDMWLQVGGGRVQVDGNYMDHLHTIAATGVSIYDAAMQESFNGHGGVGMIRITGFGNMRGQIRLRVYISRQSLAEFDVNTPLIKLTHQRMQEAIKPSSITTQTEQNHQFLIQHYEISAEAQDRAKGNNYSIDLMVAPTETTVNAYDMFIGADAAIIPGTETITSEKDLIWQ